VTQRRRPVGDQEVKMLEEFKKFAMRGNVVDMAVGIIIGAAFGKIVSSFVADVIMPPIGLLMGGVDFSNLMITLKEATADTEVVAIKYGMFVNTIIDFLIVAIAIFAVVQMMNRMQRKEEAKPAPPPPEVQLLTEIRDALKKPA
jgi:large conductance mechanosensitive channel